MTEELANLLIKVSSVGFDEVLKSLREVEQAAKAISSGGGLGELQNTLDHISGSLDEFKEGMRTATKGFRDFEGGAKSSGEKLDAHTQSLHRNQEMLATLTKAYASFWVMFNAPRQFFSMLDGIAKFNTELSTMSEMTGVSRGVLLELGKESEKFGGSTQSMAALMSRARQAMQSFRMGQGGGAFEQAAAMYGLDISGTGQGGLATGLEMTRNIVAALEALPDKDSKLGLKNLLGISDADYQVFLQGTKAFDDLVEKGGDNEKNLKGADEATKRWNDATKELSKDWEILKTQVFVELVPYVSKIADFVADITRESGRVKELLSAIWVAAVAIGTAVAAWKFAQAVAAAVKLLGVLKSIKALGGAGAAAGGVGGGFGGGAPAGGGVGGGGRGGLLSFVGLGVDIGNGIANSIGAGAGLGTAQNTGNIYTLLKGWFLLWQTATVNRYGVGYKETAKQYKSAFKNLTDEGLLDKEAAEGMAEQFAEMDRRRRTWERTELRFLEGKGGGKDAESSNGGAPAKVIHVTMHIGTLESSAENYGGLVKELLNSAKDVVAQRLEVADWFDSNSGVIVA